MQRSVNLNSRECSRETAEISSGSELPGGLIEGQGGADVPVRAFDAGL